MPFNVVIVVVVGGGGNAFLRVMFLLLFTIPRHLSKLPRWLPWIGALARDNLTTTVVLRTELRVLWQWWW